MRTQDLPADDEVPQAKESSPPRPMTNAIQPTVTKALTDVTVKSALQEWYTFDLDQDSHWRKMKQSRGKVKAIVEWGTSLCSADELLFLKSRPQIYASGRLEWEQKLNSLAGDVQRRVIVDLKNREADASITAPVRGYKSTLTTLEDRFRKLKDAETKIRSRLSGGTTTSASGPIDRHFKQSTSST
jgi:hypothetical protein